MLQRFSERIQGAIAWTIISVVAFTFTLFGIDSYLQSHRNASNTIASVDKYPITKQALELQYRRMRGAQAQDNASWNNVSESALRSNILDEMIANQVNLQAAQKQGFKLDKMMAQAAIFQIPQFQENGAFSLERYQQALNSAMYTNESFQKEVEQGMLLNQQRFAFMGTAFALSNEVKRFVKLYGQTRNYRYLIIPSHMFTKQVEVSMNEIKTYYDKHHDEFISDESVELSYVALSQSDIVAKLNPTKGALKDYYKVNQTNYMVPARWYVQRTRFKLNPSLNRTDIEKLESTATAFYETIKQQPTEFEAASNRLKQDKTIALETETLPWIVAGESDLYESMINLTHEGDITPPISSDSGFDIYKLLAYEPAHVQAYPDVINEVKQDWLTEQAQIEFNQLQDILSEQSYQTPDELESVSDAVGLPIQHSDRFTQSAPGNTTITQSQAVIQAAFSHDVLELGNNSQPIQVDDDTLVVIRVKSHQPAELKPLKEVSVSIENLLRQSKSADLSKAMGERILSEPQLSLMTENDLKLHQMEWKKIDKAARDAHDVPSAINQKAFEMSNPPSTSGILLPNRQGYAVIQLQHIEDGDYTSLDSEQLASISQQIAAHYGANDYDLYVNHLLELSVIKR